MSLPNGATSKRSTTTQIKAPPVQSSTLSTASVISGNFVKLGRCPLFPRKQTIIAVWVQTEHVDRSASALQPEFLRDHLFYVENSRRASERCFGIVRHSFQRTLPIAEAFQAIRIRQ